MLKLKFIMVDKTRSPFLKDGEDFYLNRIRRYSQFEWIEVRPVRITKGLPEEEVKNTEGRTILQKVNAGDYLVTLDRSGREYDSEGLAEWLKTLSVNTRGSVCFTIGGPVGLSTEILKKAGSILSLSRMTLTHEMSRLVLLEQIYRAFTIIKGEKYHK